MRIVRFAGERESHVVAKVKNDRGQVVKVDLGPRSQIDRLRVVRGQKVTIFGTEGKVNGRRMLIAHRIQREDGQSQSVRRRSPLKLRKLQGIVLETRTDEAHESNSRNLLARVRLDDGRITVVNLGRHSNLYLAPLHHGQEISMLVRSPGASGNNRSPRRALQFEIDGRVYRPERSEMFPEQERRPVNRDDEQRTASR